MEIWVWYESVTVPYDNAMRGVGACSGSGLDWPKDRHSCRALIVTFWPIAEVETAHYWGGTSPLRSVLLQTKISWWNCPVWNWEETCNSVLLHGSLSEELFCPEHSYDISIPECDILCEDALHSAWVKNSWGSLKRLNIPQLSEMV